MKIFYRIFRKKKFNKYSPKSEHQPVWNVDPDWIFPLLNPEVYSQRICKSPGSFRPLLDSRQASTLVRSRLQFASIASANDVVLQLVFNTVTILPSENPRIVKYYLVST
jgi:hypothetical protein